MSSSSVVSAEALMIRGKLKIKKRMPKCVGGITWPKHAHAQSQFWAIKTDL